MEVQPVLSITELEGLAAERPLQTVEQFQPNDFYGHAMILKSYCGLSPEYQLPGIVPHGPNSTDRVWDYEVNHELPFFLLSSRYQQALYSTYSAKPSVIIGSPFCYARRLMASDLARIEPHARGTVAFPIHSTHHVTTDYDRNTFMEFLGRLPSEFHPIHICVYWRDIQLGRHREYLKAGFECTTAGHMYDPQFHFRLLQILARHKVVITNEIGGASYYAAATGLPVIVHRQEYRISANNKDRLAEASIRPNSPIVEMFLKSSSLSMGQMQAFQRQLAEYALGVDHLKAPEELRNLFLDLSSRLKGIASPSQRSPEMSEGMDARTDGATYVARTEGVSGTPVQPEHQFIKRKPMHPANIVEGQRDSADTLSPSPVQEIKQDENDLRKTDIMVASYPRSGNTWMRLLLSDVILQSMGLATETELPINQDYIVPDIHQGQLDAIDPRIKLGFRLIKTHARFSSIPRKTIYIFRSPADTLCSYFHFHRRYEHLAYATKVGIDTFCRNRLKDWGEHLESFIQAKERGDAEILFVSYEWMHEDPVAVLRLTAEFIDIPVTDEMCRKAVDNHVFQKHRGHESLGEKYREYFFRKGQVGNSSTELQAETIQFIEQNGDTVYQKALCFQGAGIPGIPVPETTPIRGKSPPLPNLCETLNWMKMTIKALDAHDVSSALRSIAKAKARRTRVQGIDYLRAICFLRMNLPDGAREALREELRAFPHNEGAKALLSDILSQFPEEKGEKSFPGEFDEILNAVRSHTMLSKERLFSLFNLARQICDRNIPGDFVECGVAGGGSTALLAAVISRHSKTPRRLYACDSYEGMPAPTEHDMHGNQHAEATGWGTGTCAAPETCVKEICARLGVSNIVTTVKGYFRDTLPQLRQLIGPMALLHMDADWYESTRDILANLYDRVSPGGFIQVDDYDHWEGCRKALHEFETARGHKFDLNQIDNCGVYFRKPDTQE
jgi:hypothetical protein